MNITTIQLIGDTYQNNKILSVPDGASFPVTLSISDIKDLSKKTGVFSKTIKINGNKNNNKILGDSYDVNLVTGEFNINKLHYCNVIQNGVIILNNMLLQLISVDKIQSNNSYESSIEYSLLIKDTTGDFFSSINTKFLTDLDLTGLLPVGYVYSAQNIKDSFNNTYVDGFKYVMPYVPNLQNDLLVPEYNFKLTEFSPAIYVRQYFDRIFQQSGYTYNWPSMDYTNINLSNLVIPYNGEAVILNKVNAPNQKVEVQQLGVTQYMNSQIGTSVFTGIPTLLPYPYSGTNPIQTPDEILDPSNNFNTTTNVYSTPNLPNNTINTKYSYKITWALEVYNPTSQTVYLRHKNKNLSTGLNEFVTDDAIVTPFVYIKHIENTNDLGVKLSSNLKTIQNRIITNNSSFPSGTTNLISEEISSGTMIITNLNALTDLIFCGSSGVSPVTGSNGNKSVAFFNSLATNATVISNVIIRTRITNIQLVIDAEISGDVSWNVPVNINNYIPKQIKQSDFIKSIFTMFNLYCTPNKDNLTQLDIKTRDEYYDSGVNKNWSKKLDKSKNQELKFLPEIVNKKLRLKYKDDEDWANKTYKKIVNETYGQVDYIFDNEYVKGITTIEVIFSPTPIMNNTRINAVLPLLEGGFPNNNIRILYDGGELSCNSFNILNYYIDDNNQSGSSCNTYPHISHLDSPTNPTFDLNFALCDFSFRTDEYGDTNNNLYNLHWRRTINQINEGKQLIAYFNLNEVDIMNLSLNDRIKIDNSYWTISKVQDYNCNNNEPTKVELISADDQLPVEIKIRPVKRLSNISPVYKDMIEYTKDYINSSYMNTNQSLGALVDIKGKNNRIGSNATGGIIFGNGNVFNGSGILLGNNNTIDDGVNNIIINGDNINATQSGTLYTNNIILPSNGTINGTPISNISNFWGRGTGNKSIIRIDDALTVQAVGPDSISLGNGTYASGALSLAYGLMNTSNGMASKAEGQYTESNGDYSTSAGSYNISDGENSSTHGLNNKASTFCETVIGSYATEITGNATTFDSNDPILRVGIGVSGAPKDGLIFYKNSAIKLNAVTTGSITTPSSGMVVINSVNNSLSYYDGTDWLQYIEVPTSTTGTSIVFARPLVYNSPTSAGTGNITSSLTNARIGIVQKIYHQSGTAPTFPTGWVLLRGSYSLTLLNIIYCEWVTSTRVEYWIVN